MNLKKKFRAFFAPTRKDDGGFTLVELIVVIAILAILAGVAVPAYSGYIAEANKTADMNLVSDIEQAITMALYNDFDHQFSDAIIVKLSPAADAVVVSSTRTESDAIKADISFVENAMKSAFGENWSSMCMLSYDGWESGAASVVATYRESSYNGNEDALMAKMGVLTGAMADFFNSGNRNIPDHIVAALGGNASENDPNALANATVIALGNSISNADPAVRAEVEDALANLTSDANVKQDEETGEWGADLAKTQDRLTEAYTKIYGTYNETTGKYEVESGSDAENMVTLAVAATLYANAEAYSQYCAEQGYYAPQNALNINFSSDASSKDILGQVLVAFETVVSDGLPGAPGNQYAQGFEANRADKDAASFLAVMDAIAQSSDTLTENVASSTFYTDGTAASLLRGYIAVGSIDLADGEAAVIINQDKTVVHYLGGIG